MSDFNDTSYELLSAYLDGELSQDECARVESLLETSEEHLALFNDLKDLSGRFEAIPRHRAPAQLNSRIMDAIEKQPAEPIAQPQVAAKADHAARVDDRVEPAETAAAANWTRGWIRLAIAASLLAGAWVAYRTFILPTPQQDLIVQPGPQPPIPDDGGTPVPDVPREVIPPEMGFVFQEVEADLLMIFDYTVEPRVLEDGTFKNTLKMHDVEVNDTIIPDPAAQRSILESAAFGVAGKADQQQRAQVQFSIVVADIDTLFLISQSLASVKGVKSMRADLSVNPTDMQMMRSLERSRKDQFADADPIKTGRAYFVSLGGDIQSALLGTSGAMMKLDGLAGGANLGQQALDGEERVMPVAFILRAAAN